MLESFKKHRAHFPGKGKQQEWLDEVRSSVSISEMAKICACSERTIRDWQREKFHMDHACMEKLCRHLDIPQPTVKKVDTYAHTKKAGQMGGAAIVKKYGGVPVNESYRKDRWKSWWENEGKNKDIPTITAREIVVPDKSSDLAEFIGIMLGDGTVAPYHIAVTLHSVDDKTYSEFVTDLIKKLFGVTSKVYKKKGCKAVSIVVARKRLVDFAQEIGLPKGNKMRAGLAIPIWVMENNRYAAACVRGLMDTDGSAFTHSYVVKGKKYSYKKFSFTSADPRLREDFITVLERFGIAGSCSGRNVRIESREGVEKYLQKIGSHNTKHLKRMEK